MFLIVGVMLTVYGVATRGSDIYLRSAGMNINFIWGLVMFVFGLAMFLLGRYSGKHPKPQPPVEGASRPLSH
jgi:hypothetical protein